MEVFNLSTNSTVPVQSPTYDPATRTARFPVATADRMFPRGNYEFTIVANDVSPSLVFDATHRNFFDRSDLNRDRVVNSGDKNRVVRNFGVSVPLWLQGDTDLSGSITVSDIARTSAAFGSSLPAPPDFSTTLTVNAEPQPENTNLTPIRVSWTVNQSRIIDKSGADPIFPTTYRVYRRSAGVGGAFTQVSPENATFISVNGGVAWVDNTAQDGTKYDYRVRPVYADGTMGGGSMVRSATSILPALEITDITLDDAGGVVHFKDNSRNESGFQLTITNLASNSTQVVTLPPNADGSDYGFFSGLNPNTPYGFSLRAINPATSSGSFTGSPKMTEPASGVLEPGKPWSTIIGYNGLREVNTTETWTRPGRLNLAAPTEVKISGLPRHTYVSVGVIASVSMTALSSLYPNFDVNQIQFTANVGGQTIPLTRDTRRTLFIWSGAATVAHQSTKIEGKIEASGLPAGVGYGTWDTPGFGMATYMPFVGFESKTVRVFEHATTSGGLSLRRSGPNGGYESEKVLEKPLTIELRDVTPSDLPRAAIDDFQPSSKMNPKIEAGQVVVDLDYLGKDDTEIEPEIEFLRVEVASSKQYMVYQQHEGGEAAVGDDDFEIKGLQVFYNDLGLTRDTGYGQEAYVYDYSVPHWNDADGNGLVAGAGEPQGRVARYDNTKQSDKNPEVSFPLNYVRSTPGGPTLVSGWMIWRLRGNPQLQDIEGVEGNVSGGVVGGKMVGAVAQTWRTDEDLYRLATFRSDTAMGDTINAGNIDVKWDLRRVKRDGPVKQPYGTTTNRAYVTGAAVPREFHTVVAVGSGIPNRV